MNARYATKVWHRGVYDWAWKARDRWGNEFASGSAVNRREARAKATAAVEALKLQDRARWIAV